MRTKRINVLGKMKLGAVGWEIYDGYNAYGESYLSAEPICSRCQTQLKLNDPRSLQCEARTCKKFGQEIVLEQDFTYESQLARKMWEGRQRRNNNIQWIDFNRELLPLASDEKTDDDHWVKAFLYNSSEGRYLMVLAGNKNDKNNKVQFFVKDEVNLVAFDQIGDLNPKEIFLGFKAQFSDGTLTKTTFKGKEQPES